MRCLASHIQTLPDPLAYLLRSVSIGADHDADVVALVYPDANGFSDVRGDIAQPLGILVKHIWSLSISVPTIKLTRRRPERGNIATEPWHSPVQRLSYL